MVMLFSFFLQNSILVLFTNLYHLVALPLLKLRPHPSLKHPAAWRFHFRSRLCRERDSSSRRASDSAAKKSGRRRSRWPSTWETRLTTRRRRSLRRTWDLRSPCCARRSGARSCSQRRGISGPTFCATSKKNMGFISSETKMINFIDA